MEFGGLCLETSAICGPRGPAGDRLHTWVGHTLRDQTRHWDEPFQPRRDELLPSGRPVRVTDPTKPLSICRTSGVPRPTLHVRGRGPSTSKKGPSVAFVTRPSNSATGRKRQKNPPPPPPAHPMLNQQPPGPLHTSVPEPPRGGRGATEHAEEDDAEGHEGQRQHANRNLAQWAGWVCGRRVARAGGARVEGSEVRGCTRSQARARPGVGGTTHRRVRAPRPPTTTSALQSTRTGPGTARGGGRPSGGGAPSPAPRPLRTAFGARGKGQPLV